MCYACGIMCSNAMLGAIKVKTSAKVKYLERSINYLAYRGLGHQ